jgi:hypothetical protein
MDSLTSTATRSGKVKQEVPTGASATQMAITSANTLVKEARTAGILIKERNSHDEDSKSIL